MSRRIRDQTSEERRLEAELLRDEFDEADRIARPALVQLVKSMAEEDATLSSRRVPQYPTAVYAPPEAAFEQRAAAGGYAATFTLDFEDEGSLQVDASWTSDRIDLKWDYRRLEPSSFLILAFRDPEPSRFLAPPQIAGRVDQQAWSATADELGINLDSAWEFVALVMRDG